MPTTNLPEFPNDKMKAAYNLRAKQGKSDKEIGRILGVTREWACKLRNEFQRRVDQLQRIRAVQGDEAIIEAILN